MELFEGHLDSARRSLKVAEHMLTRTYPVVDDPKLILAVAGDIYAAVASGMDAVLAIEGDVVGEDFASRLDSFKATSGARGFSEDDIALLEDMHRIMQEHRDSPVEFPRRDRFVICDEKYRCDVISLDDMKKYLFRAGLFVGKVEGLIDSRARMS